MDAAPRCARERIETAFVTLIKEKPYQKITVSSIIAAANVNRSTFYRNFENVEDLMECITEELTQKIVVPPTFPIRNTADLEQYSMQIFQRAQEYHHWVTLLCGENGKMEVAYRVASAASERLVTEAKAAGINDPAVLRVAEMASPQLSFYFIAGELPQEQNTPAPVPEIRYDNACSILQNVARLLAKRLGGNEFFHYDLLCAYVILDAATPESYRTITVSQLLATAGIHRTEFYKYYKNIEDFFEAFEDACVHCALYWLSTFLDTNQWPDEKSLDILINKDRVRVSINKFFTHGRISAYFPKILNLVLRYVNGLLPGGLTDDKIISCSYYISEFAYAICTYLTGLSDYPTLKKTMDHLQVVFRRNGL